MTEEEKERDFLKEDLKSNYEYLRTYALFILGLSTSEGTLLLKEDLMVNQITMFLFVINSIALVVMFGYLISVFMNISFNIEKLKNL